MRLLLLTAALLATTSMNAQHFSAGARSGIGFWKGEVYNPWTWSFDEQRKSLWEKELFVRYEAAGPFAFELGLNQVQNEYDGEVFGLCGTGLPDHYSYISGRRITEQYYGLNLRVQYGLSCPRVPRLRNYPGIVLTPTMRILDDVSFQRNVSPSGTSDGGQVITTTRDSWMQIGFEDMIRYRVNQHLDVHSLISCKHMIGGNQLQRAFMVQAGVSYVF